MEKLKVLWLDGYEVTFDLKVGSTIRFEALYIHLVTASDGERFIPLSNVRWFGYTS